MAAEKPSLDSIFCAAVEIASEDERAAYLARACSDDQELRARVEKLLVAHFRAGSFLEEPVQPPRATEAGASRSPELGVADALAERPGTVIGPYKLLQQIGEGGMGVVFMAEQTKPVQRRVALKIIKPGMDSCQVIARFEAERQALAVMDHPNIAKVLDAGTTETGRPYFVMELVKGRPITLYCDERRLTPKERLELFLPVCQAVQHAHQKGIIHRDLKPSNVLIALYDGKPVPKVIDFGVAKATGPKLTERTLFTEFGQIVGTLEYMSPEQAELNQLDIDTRSDIYSLGVLLYELLTGTTPLEKKQLKEVAVLEVLRLIREVEPPRPSTRLSTTDELPSVAANRSVEPKKLSALVRGELDWIVMKALEKDRNRRYESANGLALDLQRYLHDEQVEACPPSVGYRLRKIVRRNKGRFTAATAVLLSLFAGAVVSTWQVTERQRERQVVAARESQVALSLLDQAEASLKAGKLADMQAALDQVELRLADSDSDASDLRHRLSMIEADRDMLRKLEDIMELRWRVANSNVPFNPDNAKTQYHEAFTNYGLAVAGEPQEETLTKFRQSRIAGALLTGLSDWFFLDPHRSRLQTVLDAADPDPVRSALRAAVAAGHDDRVREIVTKANGEVFTPEFATALGTYPTLPDEECLRVMRVAWNRRPNFFPLAMAIVTRLAEADSEVPGRALEAVGWCRTAIALRPESALAYFWLGEALDKLQDQDARFALEQAVRLAPRFGRATFELGQKLLDEQGSRAKAVQLFDNFIQDNPNNPIGYLGRYAACIQAKDWVGAAQAYRRVRELLKVFEEQGRPLPDGDTCFASGFTYIRPDNVILGLIRSGRSSDAFQLFSENPDQRISMVGHHLMNYDAACAAALLAAEKGTDVPGPERPKLRNKCLELLSGDLVEWKRIFALPISLGASTVGLQASTLGQGPFLAASALFSRRTVFGADRAENCAAVHEQMTDWLSDPDLTGLREEKALTLLSAEERQKWQQLWAEVRSLRDRSAPLPLVEK